MAVVIRMKRTGRRNRPCYRISVADRAVPRDGSTLETLGHYDPASPVADLRLKLDVERARYWVGKGALPSETVASIFRRHGVYEGITPPRKRQRKGRNAKTATRTRREAQKKTVAERKDARRAERATARRAAAAAAATPS